MPETPIDETYEIPPSQMASDINKPNGQFTVPFHRKGMLDFLDPKPVRKLPGVGKVTEHLLTSLGARPLDPLAGGLPLLPLLPETQGFIPLVMCENTLWSCVWHSLTFTCDGLCGLLLALHALKKKTMTQRVWVVRV